MSFESYLRAIPKAELHVHLEGSIRPETLLKLAARHQVPLPASSVEGLRHWYTFRDFTHFAEIYQTFARCLRTPEDLELVAREFLAGQAAQNILYSEVTYTAYSQYRSAGMDFEPQLAALNRARQWGEQALGVHMGLVIDISRELDPSEGLTTARWAVQGMGRGVVALGLGGMEAGNPPEKFVEAFALARRAGLPAVPHAGETCGPESIWGALRALRADRVGHGITCLQDPALVAELCRRRIPLEVCPTSNVCLGVAPSMREHPLPRLLEAGLVVTLGSDDPPMFNTTLSDEYVRVAQAFGLGVSKLEALALNGLRCSFLPEAEKEALERRFRHEFIRLAEEHGVLHLIPTPSG